jgi:hypothetical protein
MSNFDWSTIVGAGPGTPETSAGAKRLSVALGELRSNLSTSPHTAAALQNYLELSWLSLSHQEQVDRPGESSEARSFRISSSVSERRALQRLVSELFSVLNPTKGMHTPVAGETSHKNQH